MLLHLVLKHHPVVLPLSLLRVLLLVWGLEALVGVVSAVAVWEIEGVGEVPA